MRYIRLRTWALLLAVVIGVILVLTYAEGERGIYKSSLPISDSLVTAHYPDLFEAIAGRDFERLEPFLSHESPEMRNQAWRALANTPIDSLGSFLSLAMDQNSETAWFGISQHDLTGKQLRMLEKNWQEHPAHRAGIARVLGQQGDEQTLEFLLDHLDTEELGNEYQFALAVGRLINRYDVSGQDQIWVLQNAFDADGHDTTRAYLYGWYRGDESRLSTAARDTLFSRWQVMGTGISAKVDQYVNKMLKERTTSQMTIFYNGEQRLDNESQLAVELAGSIGEIALNDRGSLAAKVLLTNENPHVQVQILESIRSKISLGDNLYDYITGSMLTDSELSDFVWIHALKTAAELDTVLVEKYAQRLQSATDRNGYLLPPALSVYQQAEDAQTYLQRIDSIAKDGEALKTTYALQSANEYWQNLAAGERTSAVIEQMRSIVFQALDYRDRGVVFSAQPLLQDEQLFAAKDFKRINNTLAAFSLPADIEVFQAFGSLYKDRFESQAQPVIDSLAAQNYGPLNRSLVDAGWNVEIPENSSTEFRTPDWDRLWELGQYPVWRLETEKGNISIELNTLSAPATVSMIDSLSRSGVYDDVPFHRVVANFVIQGGDIERNDGFGGPDFVLPTEASDQEFERGAVGIASAGTDTEGSQYFIMHQWKPHLNGQYTRLGRVVEGMRVVDKITPGDKVISTTWY